MLHDQEQVLEGEQASCNIILIVADDPDLGKVLVDVLTHKSHCHVLLATNGFAALKLVRHITPQLFILEHRLPNMNGMALYHGSMRIEHSKLFPPFLSGAVWQMAKTTGKTAS